MGEVTRQYIISKEGYMFVDTAQKKQKQKQKHLKINRRPIGKDLTASHLP